MKLTLRIGAAIGIAALGACTVNEDNGGNVDVNSAAAGEETVLPADESSAAGADTLGNQLDQLNESDASLTSETANEGNSN